MTDNEIIKALEFDKNSELDQEVLNLINRQKAEIERLQKSNGEMFVTISEQDAEIEELKSARRSALKVFQLHTEIRAEAIKEFAETAKSKAHFSEDFGEACVSCYDLDNLVKEMTGGSE